MIGPEPADLPQRARFTCAGLDFAQAGVARAHYEAGVTAGLEALKSYRHATETELSSLAMEIRKIHSTPPDEAPLGWRPLEEWKIRARLSGFWRAVATTQKARDKAIAGREQARRHMELHLAEQRGEAPPPSAPTGEAVLL